MLLEVIREKAVCFHTMKRVTILGLTGSSGTMMTGPFDIFYYAGRMWNDILGIKERPIFNGCVLARSCWQVPVCSITKLQQPIGDIRIYSWNCILLAGNAGMSRHAFEQRFKAATGDTPLKYLQRIRVEAAKRMIESQRISFDEITCKVGYDNSSYFRKIFTKLRNMTPKHYPLKWGSGFSASHI